MIYFGDKIEMEPIISTRYENVGMVKFVTLTKDEMILMSYSEHLKTPILTLMRYYV